MIEVEIKLPVKESIKDHAALAAEFCSRGFEQMDQIIETDLYFDNASQQIRKGGQALRIRSIQNLKNGKTESVITFKGKKLDQVSMTRKELETGIADAGVCRELLEELGFSFVPPAVVKKRREYKKGNLTACLDQVQGLGDYLELEIVIPDNGSLTKDAALSQIEHFLTELGYSLSDTTRHSYLSMLQAKL